MKLRLRKVRPPKEKQLIGMTDLIDLPELDLFNIGAKVDTGAFTSALHCKDVRLERENGQTRLFFSIVGQNGLLQHQFVSDDFSRRLIRNSFGVAEMRFVIKTRIKLFGRVIRSEFTLADRERMRYPVLLGRKLLRGRFVVDVSKKNLSFALKKQPPAPPTSSTTP